MNTLYEIELDFTETNPAAAGCILAGVTTGKIPIIAEIEPHADPVYGHTFKWPAQEVDQFVQQRVL
jgi:hypothetical protein